MIDRQRTPATSPGVSAIVERMRPQLRSIALLVAAASVACRGADEIATPTPEASKPSAPEIAIATERSCGEAGATPTPLPPTLARGMAPVGRGVLRAGESQTVGTVVVRHDRSAWIGSTENGHSGPALYVEIDRAEADGGPWGGQQELRPGSAFRMHVGPYRLDARSSGGAPVESVEFAVARAPCPAAATIERSATPVWLWLSTEAIRQHTYDLQGPLLQVTIDARGTSPRLDVMQLGYRHWFEPRPGEPRIFRVGADVVTIDEVVPGPDTRFAGAWAADGDARLHARVRIESAPAVVAGEATAPTTECGGPSPRRTLVPDHLQRSLTNHGEVTLAPGQRAPLGPFELELITTVVPDPRGREDRSYQSLRVHGAAQLRDVSLGEVYTPRVARIDDALFGMEPTDKGLLRVRRAALTCPEALTIPTVTAPTHVWLSTQGYARVTIGDQPIPALTLQLFVDPANPVLSVTAEHAYLSRTIAPTDAGQAFTLEGFLVEIVDIRPNDDTNFQDGRWLTKGLTPALHVQLRVSPAP